MYSQSYILTLYSASAPMLIPHNELAKINIDSPHSHAHTGPDMVVNPTANPTTLTSLNAALVTQPVDPVPPPAAKVFCIIIKI